MPIDIKQLREQWKKEAINSLYPPEVLAAVPKKRRKKGEQGEGEYVTPELPFMKRFEGAWIVGSQGSGKTQFFKRQAGIDLDMVAAGKASLFILDPTGDQPPVYDDDGNLVESATLIHTITRLRRFYKGGVLHGKLIYINPEDRDYFIPINLFSVPLDPDDDDAVDSVLDSYISIINGLLGQTLTRFQDPVLRHAILATMAFPNPTLATLRDVLTVYPPASKSYTPPPPVYEQYLYKLDPDVQGYFRSTYDSQRDSRTAVLARLASLTASNKFRRIFSGTTTKLNMAELINEPKVIVINASRQYLGELKELHGRFFISLLKRAGEARPSGSIPCFAYVDECNEFLETDQYAGEIIFKLRRKRVGLMLGNQATSQIAHPTTRRAFFSTAIKLVNVNEPDSAKEIAEALSLKNGNQYRTDYFMGRLAFDFAYYCRGATTEPIPFRFQPGILESEPAMTEAEFAEIYDKIRKEYYEPLSKRSTYKQSVTTAPDEPPTASAPPATKSAPKPAVPEAASPRKTNPKPKSPKLPNADEFDTDFEL